MQTQSLGSSEVSSLTTQFLPLAPFKLNENAGYEKQVTSGGIEKILSAVNLVAPLLVQAEVVETWCGLRPGTPDQLPILGPADIEGLVFATGHYRNGILLAPITAKLAGEWISDRRVSFDWEQFSPLRFTRTGVDRSASASRPL